MLKFLFLLTFVYCGETYKAAVFEHHPLISGTPEETILKNLNIYRRQIEEARDKGVDIIVFPEYGLTTLHVDPEKYAINVSDKTTKVIEDLTNLAIEHNIYIVVNLLEKTQENGNKRFYNSNLVFARNGTIIAKYRKINLMKNEHKLTAGTEIVTFRTDFGVTFGVLSSSDIMSKHLSKKVLNDKEVTDIVYPTALQSIVPFYTSLGVQRGYVLVNRVNLLAAGYNYPEEGYGGSGVYCFDGTIAGVYSDVKSSSKLIVEEVKKLVTREESIGVNYYAMHDRQSITDITESLRIIETNKCNFKNVNLSSLQISETVCQNSLCCTFNISVGKANVMEIYKLMVYKEEKDILNPFGVCSLLICDNDSDASCGKLRKGTTQFNRIETCGNFDETVIPIALTDRRPISNISYFQSGINATLETLASSVSIFGMIGGVSSQFQRDPAEKYLNNDSSCNCNSFVASVIIFLFAVFVLLQFWILCTKKGICFTLLQAQYFFIFYPITQLPKDWAWGIGVPSAFVLIILIIYIHKQRNFSRQSYYTITMLN